jgi:hypothetical protein
MTPLACVTIPMVKAFQGFSHAVPGFIAAEYPGVISSDEFCTFFCPLIC